MGTNILVYISLVASGIALALGVYASLTSSRMSSLRKIFGAEKPDNLDEVIDGIVAKLTQLDTHAKETRTTLEAVATQLNTATQNVGMIRYNSHGEDGGNLSFSAAFLDGHQSGIVLTSLHGRQNNRIYAKVITQGSSESTLSDEEREAVMNALTSNAGSEAPTSNKKSNKNRKT